MRLVGRILFVGAVATLPAVVAVIGCAVDSDRYPGIKNDIPNTRKASAGTTSSSGSSSSTTSSGTGGPMPTLCQCAATFVSMDGGNCGQCASDNVKADGGCTTQQTACINNNCTDALTCVSGCAGDAACIAGCIKGNAAYQELLNCQCANCVVACSVPNGLTCNLGTGTGGAGGGGTGGAGGGGGPADAGDGG